MRQAHLIISKLPSGSLIKGMRLEAESWLVTLLGAIPGFIGMILRNLIYNKLFKKLEGFSLIQNRVIFVNTDQLTVGKFFGCNSGTYINALGGIKIGDHVLIGNNVTISSGKHEIDSLELPIIAEPTTPRGITIEDDVWIGAGAVVMPGVVLRRGSVVGANAVVTRDTQEFSVNVGVPAIKIRTRKAK